MTNDPNAAPQRSTADVATMKKRIAALESELASARNALHELPIFDGSESYNRWAEKHCEALDAADDAALESELAAERKDAER